MTLQQLLLLIATILAAATASNPESTAWLKENGNKEGVITLRSGLQYKVLKSGTGMHHPTINSPTSCHYEGTLIDGTKFDSSYDRGSPTTFEPQQVIKGWLEVMQLMVEGDKWELYIPSELGYGDHGSPPKIGGGDALIFIMEIIEIQGDKVPAKNCDIKTYENCSEKEKAYVDKAKQKFASVDAIKAEILRIYRVSQKVSVSARDWANTRVRILLTMQQAAEQEEL